MENQKYADFNGHTGYDIAMTREEYDSRKGFYSMSCTGGDFLMWSLLAQNEYIVNHPLQKLISTILQREYVPSAWIGCSE